MPETKCDPNVILRICQSFLCRKHKPAESFLFILFQSFLSGIVRRSQFILGMHIATFGFCYQFLQFHQYSCFYFNHKTKE